MNDAPLSDHERARRKKAIDFARTNIELSGFTLSPGMEALGVRFVAGELSESEYLAAALDHANSQGCGSAWKKDPGSGVIGVEKGPLIPVV